MCDKMEELLSRKLDNDLTEEENISLRAHLDECELCNEKYKALSLIKNQMSSMISEPPETLFSGTVYRAGLKKRRFAFGPFTLVTAAAAVVILAVTGVFGNIFSGTVSDENALLRGGAAESAALEEAQDDGAGNVETYSGGASFSAPAPKSGDPASTPQAAEPVSPAVSPESESSPVPDPELMPGARAGLEDPQASENGETPLPDPLQYPAPAEQATAVPEPAPQIPDDQTPPISAKLADSELPEGTAISAPEADKSAPKVPKGSFTAVALAFDELPELLGDCETETSDGFLYVYVPADRMSEYLKTQPRVLLLEGDFINASASRGLVIIDLSTP